MKKRKQEATFKQNEPDVASDRAVSNLNDDESTKKTNELPSEVSVSPSQVSKKCLTEQQQIANKEQDAVPLVLTRQKRLSFVQKFLIICIFLVTATLLYTLFQSRVESGFSTKAEDILRPGSGQANLAAPIEEQAAPADQSTHSEQSNVTSIQKVELESPKLAPAYGSEAQARREGQPQQNPVLTPTDSSDGSKILRPSSEWDSPAEPDSTVTEIPTPEAASLKIAETFYLQKDFNKAYSVYNRLRQNLIVQIKEDPMSDFLQLRMALCLKNNGDIEHADRLFRELSQSCLPIIRITTYYHQCTALMQSKQYLKARIKAYQTIALIDAVDWNYAVRPDYLEDIKADSRGASGQNRGNWNLRLASDCYFLAAESLTREVLSLCDADKTLPPELWNHSLEFDPFVNLTEEQLRQLLSSGSEKLVKAPLAPRIQSAGGGQLQNLTPCWEVICYGASIEELLSRFAANADIDIRWACDSFASIDSNRGNYGLQDHREKNLNYDSTTEEGIENSAILRNRPVVLYMSSATAQQFVTVAAGCVGLLARFDNKGIVNIFNPIEYASLSEHIDMLSSQAVSLLQNFLLTCGWRDDLISNAHFAIGLLQAQRGYLTDSIAEYKLIANRYPRASLAPFALFNSSNHKVSLRDYFGACEDLKQLIERYPDTEFSDKACLSLADATMKAGLLQEATRLYRKVYNLGLSLESQRASALGAGRCFYDIEDYESAAFWLTRYINITEDHKNRKSRDFCLACSLLGKANLTLGKYQQACQAFQLALMGELLAQEYIDTISALVKAHILQGHFVEALSSLEDSRFPQFDREQLSQTESVEILLIKASVLRSMGLVDEAIAVLGDMAQYLQNSQLKAKAVYERAKCSIAKDDLEFARKSLSEILVIIEPGSLSHEVRYELADVCLKLDENARAVSICLQLLNSAPQEPLKQKALELLATAYTRQKDYDKAALALIGQWNPGQKTQTKSDSGRIKHGDTISQSRMKQDTQHNES